MKQMFDRVFISLISLIFSFFKLGFTPCKAEQPLRGMELQEREVQKDLSMQEICLAVKSMSTRSNSVVEFHS